MRTVATHSASTYEGWKHLAERPARSRPPLHTAEELERLEPTARRNYQLARMEWHANILVRTPQVDRIHAHLWDLVDASMQDVDRVKPAAAIDARPAIGKSTTVTAFGREFHAQQIAAHGTHLDDGNTVHLPVCRVNLTGGMTVKGLNQLILHFYAHPVGLGTRIANRHLTREAADCVARHRTRLVIIDDVHFLNMRSTAGTEISNQLKWLANEYQATFLFAGVGLADTGLLSEGLGPFELASAQTARRWTLLTMEPFHLDTASDRRAWRNLLLSIEQNLILNQLRPGMLADDLADYLYARSTGMIGSLMELITRGAARAIRTGRERLDHTLLDQIRIDEAAETARTALEAKLLHRPRRTPSR